MCRTRCLPLCLLVLTVVLQGAVTWAADPPSAPDATLRRYLGALKDGRLPEAYDLVSKAMRNGKSREDWVKEYGEVGSLADVKIFGFEVGAPKIEGDKAFVPNVLKSQDKFINQMGLTEYELYTLVKEDGQWRVDQQLLVEPPDMPKWFPKVQSKSPGSGVAPAPEAGAK